MHIYNTTFTEGQEVWCRPRLIDEPRAAIYMYPVSEENIKQGYRPGHIVNINGEECWVRSDLCSTDRKALASIIS